MVGRDGVILLLFQAFFHPFGYRTILLTGFVYVCYAMPNSFHVGSDHSCCRSNQQPQTPAVEPLDYFNNKTDGPFGREEDRREERKEVSNGVIWRRSIIIIDHYCGGRRGWRGGGCLGVIRLLDLSGAITTVFL